MYHESVYVGDSVREQPKNLSVLLIIYYVFKLFILSTVIFNEGAMYAYGMGSISLGFKFGSSRRAIK